MMERSRARIIFLDKSRRHKKQRLQPKEERQFSATQMIGSWLSVSAKVGYEKLTESIVETMQPSPQESASVARILHEIHLIVADDMKTQYLIEENPFIEIYKCIVNDYASKVLVDLYNTSFDLWDRSCDGCHMAEMANQLHDILMVIQGVVSDEQYSIVKEGDQSLARMILSFIMQQVCREINAVGFLENNAWHDYRECSVLVRQICYKTLKHVYGIQWARHIAHITEECDYGHGALFAGASLRFRGLIAEIVRYAVLSTMPWSAMVARAEYQLVRLSSMQMQYSITGYAKNCYKKLLLQSCKSMKSFIADHPTGSQFVIYRDKYLSEIENAFTLSKLFVLQKQESAQQELRLLSDLKNHIVDLYLTGKQPNLREAIDIYFSDFLPDEKRPSIDDVSNLLSRILQNNLLLSVQKLLGV